MESKRIIIFGGSGFIGTSLVKYLSKLGYIPVVISRSKPSIEVEHAEWDGRHIGPWVSQLEGSYAFVNLVGKSVDCVKTPENADEILRSRVDSTRVIGEALKQITRKPKVWIQMSTAHIYGDSETALCDENSSLGFGLAPFVGKEWESEFHFALPSSIRGVIMRTSFVLGRNGGALPQLKRIARIGLGGKVGSGKQGMSWIHESDVNRFIVTSIENDHYTGIYNLSSPFPKSNQVFMSTLRFQLRVPFGLNSPAWLTRLGAKIIFKTDPELVLYGRYVLPKRLIDEGFEFHYSSLDQALVS